MAVVIRKIEIFNFRSIKNIVLRPSTLSILVGNNDIGKSNILRALNLFFTGKTNDDEPFDFQIDHNIHNNPNQKAKEIRIRLELDIPEAYQERNGDYIVWEKKWRSTGELIQPDPYYGVKVTTGARGGKKLETVKISTRSNLHGLLRNIKFVYVPAIKDKGYMSNLRAQIYAVIADVAAERFRESSAEFEGSIAKHLEDLTNEVSKSIGFNSKLALPRDLSHVFESLEFLNKDNQISLDERGDGIKTRHIPIILKFMADKRHTLLDRGAQPYSFIWGYEEPENNLELKSAIALAEQLFSYLDNGISQIFLTTHSPVFYNLHMKQKDNDGRVVCHHIFPDPEDGSTKETRNPNDLDEQMGMVQLLAPTIAEITKRIKQEQETLAEVTKQQQENICRLYVEGNSDRIIFSKALEIYAPAAAKKIKVTTKKGAGHGYVKDMLSAWRSVHKHHKTRPKCAGIVDADEPGSKVRTDWNSTDGNCESAKCFELPIPAHLMPIKKAKFKIPVVLESIYPPDVWQEELDAGNLEERSVIDSLNPGQIKKIVDGGALTEFINDEWWLLYLKHSVRKERKETLAREIIARPEQEVRNLLSPLEPLLREVINYLIDDEQEFLLK